MNKKYYVRIAIDVKTQACELLKWPAGVNWRQAVFDDLRYARNARDDSSTIRLVPCNESSWNIYGITVLATVTVAPPEHHDSIRVTKIQAIPSPANMSNARNVRAKWKLFLDGLPPTGNDIRDELAKRAPRAARPRRASASVSPDVPGNANLVPESHETAPDPHGVRTLTVTDRMTKHQDEQPDDGTASVGPVVFPGELPPTAMPIMGREKRTTIASAAAVADVARNITPATGIGAAALAVEAENVTNALRERADAIETGFRTTTERHVGLFVSLTADTSEALRVLTPRIEALERIAAMRIEELERQLAVATLAAGVARDRSEETRHAHEQQLAKAAREREEIELRFSAEASRLNGELDGLREQLTATEPKKLNQDDRESLASLEDALQAAITTLQHAATEIAWLRTARAPKRRLVETEVSLSLNVELDADSDVDAETEAYEVDLDLDLEDEIEVDKG